MNATPVPPRLEPVFSARVAVAAPRRPRQSRRRRAAHRRHHRRRGVGSEAYRTDTTGRRGLAGDTRRRHRRARGALHDRGADGALVYVRNYGYRHGPRDVLARIANGEEVDPALYYFRTAPAFETAAPQYDWLNRTVAVCSAMRTVDRVIIDFYAVR